MADEQHFPVLYHHDSYTQGQRPEEKAIDLVGEIDQTQHFL
jgi:hypothetical protein